MLRFVLLVFALNPQQDPNINLLAILLGAGFLQLWDWVSGGVYKNWCLDALEGLFALNLIMLAAATYYVEISKGNKLAVGYTSISIALVTFIGILTYHILQQLRHTKLWKKMPKVNFKFKKLNNREAVDNLNNLINDSTESVNLNLNLIAWLFWLTVTVILFPWLSRRMANSVNMFAFMKCTLNIIVGMMWMNLHWGKACMPLGWPRKLSSKEERKNQFWLSVNNILLCGSQHTQVLGLPHL